jgi:arylsulfatase A-like enzyme
MNVIWIISDTLRRQDLGAYGNKNIHTPSLDALAAKSVGFHRHYMASFPTMPARADFLTGRWTMSFMQWEPLPKDEITLAEILTSKGIHTAAVVDTPFYIRCGMNYDRGFQTFYEIPGQYHLGGGVDLHHGEAVDLRAAWRSESDCFAAQTFSQSMRWLERHYKEDFFLLIDVWDPHEPWDAPAYYTERYWPGYDGEVIRPVYGYWQDVPGYTEEKVKKAHATYCGEITMVDTWVGYFLRQVENMGLMDKTAIIFTTDHGYYFGEHGGLFGKMVFAKDPKSGQRIMGVWSRSPFYEEVSALPLFIYMPNMPPGTYSGLTSAVDLMPTVLDILGLKIPSQVEGQSLLPMMKDNSIAGREFVVSAHPFINAGDIVRSIDDVSREAAKPSSAAVTTDEWSLMYDVEPGLSELFHLLSDPGQEKNVIAQHPDVARELHQLLVKFMHQTNLSPHLMEPRLELRM